MPPINEAKATGISKLDGATSLSLAIRSAMGKISANAPTLFIKADKTPVTNINISNLIFILDILLFKTTTICSTIPDLIRALLITKTDATVITAGCEKPEKTSSKCTILKTLKIKRAVKLTNS